jgi:protein SCO1/2
MSIPSDVETAARKRRIRTIGYAAWGGVILAFALLALAVVNPGWLGGSTPIGSSAIAIGGPFTLTDQNGERITEKTFLGKPTAYFFGFTNCPDACPTTLMDMSERLKALGPDGDKFNVLFVSLDPARDTPALLKTYLESFDPRIRAATGTEAEVKDMAAKFRVYYRKVGEGDSYSIDHSAAVYLMNAKGDLVTLIDYKASLEEALAKMRRALNS